MNVSLVLDIGTNQTRFGYAGDSDPRFSTPSYFALRAEDALQENSLAINQEMIREAAEQQFLADSPPKHLFGSMLGTKNPFYEYKPLFNLKTNIIENNIIKTFFSEEICLKLNDASPKNQPMIITEPTKQDNEYRKAISQVLEEGLVSKIFISKKSVLALYSAGKTSALVLEAGAHSSTISAIEDGYVHQEAAFVSNYGGDLITDSIMDELSFENVKNENISIKDEELSLYKQSCLDFYQRIEAEKIKMALLSLDENG